MIFEGTKKSIFFWSGVDTSRQEPNGRYRYIYNDALGKRKIIYSWRLTEADSVPSHKHKEVPLREKEK